QYCSIFGKNTMLRNTLERAREILPPSRILTIINKKHIDFAREDLADQPAENIIVQPANCETGPGILYPLLHVYHRDPESVVALFPSDHFVREDRLFMAYVEDAAKFVGLHPDLLVVLGIEPDR